MRACLSILELCERFRDSSQASGASQRVQRASDALPLIGRCAGWPCTPWPFARPQPDCRFALWSSVTRLVARVHSLACAVIVRPGVASSLVCCAPRVASGCYAGRSGLSVRRSGALRFIARCVRFWRRARHEFFMARVRPQPFLHCARTCCSQRGPVLAVLRLSYWESRCCARRSVARSVALRVVRFRPLDCARVRAARQATWLILPVVICLSQRLSHACLSISDLYCETANGSLNQLWFL